jgi:hypothetical protein
MTRIKAKTPAPAPRAPKPRAKAAKASVAGQLAALDDLVARAGLSADRADALAAAISGDACKAATLVPLGAPPDGLVGALAAVARSFAQALDRCDIALDKAREALG